jgi:hypothetical protein
MLLAVVGVTALVMLTNARRQITEQAPPPKLVRDSANYNYTPPSRKVSTDNNTNNTELETPADPFAEMRLPREKAEAWLAKHHRDAASLLAVFRAQQDTNYLNEAATNFPNDPRVQIAVLSRDAYPAERRKWLDAFKESSPSNSLADYFSAQNYFQEGKTEEALQDLLAANSKPQFDNHALENQLDAEELYADTGKTERESATLGLSCMSMESIGQLPTLKRVAQGILEVMKAKSAGGQVEETTALAQLGLGLSDKLNSGDSGKFLINQLVGMATENIALSQLDKNTAYDFLDGKTPTQVLAESKRQKKELNQLAQKLPFAETQMTDAEFANYNQRVKIYGELAAIKWAVELHPATDQQP